MPKEQGVALKTTDQDWFTIHRNASPILGLWGICNMHGTNFSEAVMVSLEKKIEMREGRQGSLSSRELAVL
jgi:hypothetical protein